jgi:hypothetical protein
MGFEVMGVRFSWDAGLADSGLGDSGLGDSGLWI